MSSNPQRRYQVEHHTRYRYASAVTLSHHLLHLTPRTVPGQQLESCTLSLEPPPSQRHSSLDGFGNPVLALAYEQPHRELNVSLEMIVSRHQRELPAASDSPPWQQVVASLAYHSQPLTAAQLEAQRYRFESPHVRLKKAFAQFASDCFPVDQPLLAGASALMHKIHSEFTFDASATDIATPLATVLAERRGVCQDFAHLMLACLRSLGLAARYVSGYLLTEPPAGQPRLIGADATHAWIEIYCPTHGWIGFDPTNNCQPQLEHIVLGWGRDFTDVSPLRGVLLGGGSHDPEVAVTVTPLDESSE